MVNIVAPLMAKRPVTPSKYIPGSQRLLDISIENPIALSINLVVYNCQNYLK